MSQQLLHERQSHEDVGSLPAQPQEPRRGLDILDVTLIFARRKWLLLGFVVVGALSAFVWTLTRPKLFEGDATIMPPQEQQSSSALLGQIGMLAGLTGAASKNPSDIYVSLLESRRVTDKIAEDFHLDKVYKFKRMRDAAARLTTRTKVSAGKDGIITIKVRDTDAKRAAALSDSYASALFDLNNKLAITQAAQRRLFFDQQLSEEKDRLTDAEVALKTTEEQTGIIQLPAQTSVILSQIAQLRANITSHEVQLSSLRASSTDDNPEVVRVRSELSGLQTQLREMEGKQGASDPDNLGLPSSKVPAISLDYLRKQRDVQYHQTLFELLARQLEAARIDEAKAAPIVQVLDTSEIPDRTTYPKTKLITALGGFLGWIVGAGCCVLLYIYDYADEDPLLRPKIWAIRSELTGRRR